MLGYFRERGHRADLNPVLGGADSSEFLDPAQIDHYPGFFDAVLEPVEAVETPGQHPGFASVLLEQPLGVGNGVWLQQLKRWHHISDYSHICLLLPLR